MASEVASPCCLLPPFAPQGDPHLSPSIPLPHPSPWRWILLPLWSRFGSFAQTPNNKGEENLNMGWELTCGWTSCRELKKGSKGGRPRSLMEHKPVNRLRFSTFWKCRSQMYWGRE